MDNAADDAGSESIYHDAHDPPPKEEIQSPAPISDPIIDATKSFQAIAHSLTDQTLQFISTASNETIGACLVGLGATTYLVLGRVGLVLIGIVGGIALHASWEGAYGPQFEEIKATEEKKRREIGIDVIHRIWNWRSKKKAESQNNDQSETSDTIVTAHPTKKLDFSSYPPETAAALTELTDAAIRDYVKCVFSRDNIFLLC